MRVEYSKTARKELKKLPKSKQIKVLVMVQKLKNDPFVGKKLIGELKNLRSIKVWPYRIVYSVFSKNNLIYINIIQHRQRVYK